MSEKIHEILTQIKDNIVEIKIDSAVMKEKISNIESKLPKLEDSKNSISDEMDKKFVTKEEFKPVKSITYGLVSWTCILVLAAVIGLVITSTSSNSQTLIKKVDTLQGVKGN